MGRVLSRDAGTGPEEPEKKASGATRFAAAPQAAAKWSGMRHAVAAPVGVFKWRIDQMDTDPTRKIGLLFALAFLFARFSYAGELIQTMFGVPLYANYWTALPAIAALVLCGGLKRGMSHRGAVFLLLFALWMTAAVPLSFWPGGSFARVKDYFQFELPILILIGGLAVNWDDVKKIFTTLAWSGISVLILTRLMGKLDQGRVSLDFNGTISNANDLAAHLLLLIPFFVFVVIDSKRFFVIRALFLGATGYALYVILGTASRGALIAVVFGVVFVMVYASMGQRMALLAMIPIIAIGAVIFLPERTVGRLGTLTGEEDAEAGESKMSRRYLFEQSVIFTLQHPLFGVGPAQFANFEGNTRLKEGNRGNWHETHCSWTEVSSECGIPALILYTLAVFAPFLQVKRCYLITRRMKWAEGSNACFCFLLAMVLYLVSITFLSTAYTYRQPALIATGFVMSLAITRIVAATAARQMEMASAQAS